MAFRSPDRFEPMFVGELCAFEIQFVFAIISTRRGVGKVKETEFQVTTLCGTLWYDIRDPFCVTMW